MEKIEWKVEGMTCTNCALSIADYLKKEGLQNVNVSFIGGEVSFDEVADIPKDKLKKGIKQLGYTVVSETESTSAEKPSSTIDLTYIFTFAFLKNHLHRFLFCLPFTLVLMMHMLPWHIHFLMNPWNQLIICLPVYLVGMGFFGVSAVRSIVRGIPNMSVLIAVGATAAFGYSLVGTLGNMGPDYVFYETAATIITLVFLGEFVEHESIETTQRELNKLAKQQKVMANMIAFDDQHKEIVFQIENTQLKVGDLVLIKTGEQVPMDCKILWGDAHVNEALLTGESKPIAKTKKDTLIGGSLLTDGTVKAQVTAVGKDTVLSNILNLVKQAQSEKPPVQQLADKISAIFVPTVVGIALLTFLLSFFVFDLGTKSSLMRSIAVLVISCPCAMGLATPAAIAVGLGRAARNGILFRNARSLELFKNIKAVVFDKTGTLTKGNLSVTNYQSTIDENEFKKIVFSLEKFSNHPIAKAIVTQWNDLHPIVWKKIEEVKGAGIKAEDNDGNTYFLGAHKIAVHLTDDNTHNAYLIKNGALIGWFDMEDEIREESVEVIKYLNARNIETVLLSGDILHRTQKIADKLGIHKVYAEKTPEEKLKIIEEMNAVMPVAMVGDGINDAPALAKATIGISISEASQLAMQTAQVVLTNKGIKNIPLALGLGKHTFITIKGNLFWAFFYNIVAIPIAALGYLHPGIAALTMGVSDVVLAINSVRLNYKKVI